jgi:hypothetical protein
MTNQRRTLLAVLAVCALIAGGALFALLASDRDPVPGTVQVPAAAPRVKQRTAAEIDGAQGERERVMTPARNPERVASEDAPSGAAGSYRDDAVARLRSSPRHATPPPILVRVTSTDGYPLSGRRVSVTARKSAEQMDLAWKATPRKDGRHALALDAGSWIVSASAPAHGPSSREVLVGGDAATAELDLVLEARPSVRIVVRTPDGAAFPEQHAGKPLQLRAIATRDAPERSLHEVATRAAHQACSTLHPRSDMDTGDPTLLGLLELGCDLPLSVSLVVGLDVLETRRLERLAQELLFVIDPAAVAERVPLLTFRVVDDVTGAPLANARPHLPGFWNDVVLRGHEGRFAHAVPAGPATLEVFAVGYAKVTRELDLPRAPGFDLGTIAMRREATGEIVLEIARPDGLDPLELSWSPLAEWSGGRAPQVLFGRQVQADETRIVLPLGKWVLQGDSWLGRVRHGTARMVLDVEPGKRHVALRVEPFVDVVLRSSDRRRSVVVRDAAHGLVVAGPHVWGPGNLTIELLPGSYRATSGEEDGARPVEFVVTAAGATVDLP